MQSLFTQNLLIIKKFPLNEITFTITFISFTANLIWFRFKIQFKSLIFKQELFNY